MPAAVAGSDSGIGKASAVILAQQGWDVGITWHEDEDGANETAGEIATPMTHQEDEDAAAADRPAIPLGRPGDAREIGAVVAFLCSPQASYATGASFVIDGGMLLMAAEANAVVQS